MGTKRVLPTFAATLAFVLLLSNPGSLIAGGAKPKLKGFSPFTFAIVSDPQIGMVAAQRDRTNFSKVASAINGLHAGIRPKFVLITGDLVEDSGDTEAAVMFDQVRKVFTMPVYPVPGNHDITNDGKTFQKSLLERYHRSVGPDRFVVKKAGCLFIGLDSQLWLGAPGVAEEQFEWLKQQLRDRSQYLYVFVFEHHPLFLASADEKDQYYNTPLIWRLKLLRLFEESKVTGVLTGHLHRNESGFYHGIAMITTPSTCLNFDGSPFGYRLISLTNDGFMEQYVSVPGTLPQGQAIDSPPNIAPVSKSLRTHLP